MVLVPFTFKMAVVFSHECTISIFCLQRLSSSLGFLFWRFVVSCSKITLQFYFQDFLYLFLFSHKTDAALRELLM